MKSLTTMPQGLVKFPNVWRETRAINQYLNGLPIKPESVEIERSGNHLKVIAWFPDNTPLKGIAKQIVKITGRNKKDVTVHVQNVLTVGLVQLGALR